MILRLHVVLLFAAGAAFADGPEAKHDITVELRCIVLPQATAIPLIAKLRLAKMPEREPALAEIDGLLAKGVARLAGWPFVTVHDRQKATVEAIEEIRFASQFEGTTNNVYVSDDQGKLTKQPSSAISADSEPVASGFDTRNVGVTLEIEPTVYAEGRTVSLSVVAQHVRLQAIDRLTIEHELTSEKRSEKTIQEQPRFSTLKMQSELFLESGEQRLIGIFRVPGEENQIELFILGVEVVGK